MISQIKKSELLEDAVINKSAEELTALYNELGYVEFSARALGLACRFCGIEKVKALVDCGATFDIPIDERVENLYHIYSGTKHDNYRSNFALYLLYILKHIKGACCFKGLKLLKQIATADKKKLPQLPDSERAEVLKFLCENKEKISFEPSEMLYYAIFARDEFIVSELKKLGVGILKTRVEVITRGGLLTNPYCYEFRSMMNKLDNADYIAVMGRLLDELGGGKFHCTEKIFEDSKKRFSDPKIAEFFFENFEMDKLNKTAIIRGMIDENAVSALPLVEKTGWLANTKRRDELIEYARKKNRVECTAWLLDFKNRTADLAAEREKAEKKMERELNADPNSVSELKKIWSYKKLEDGGLVITNYKGTATEIVIPEKIGKSVVTAIGRTAFAAANAVGGGTIVSYATFEQIQARRDIKKLTLPKTLKYIGEGAFVFLESLEAIEIPEGVEEIDSYAFQHCNSLTEITIPGTVKKIGTRAFSCCENLRRVKICEGVIEIGEAAFYYSPSLRLVELPRSVEKLLTLTDKYNTLDAFGNCPKLVVSCPAGSYAEKYCREKGIKVIGRSE